LPLLARPNVACYGDACLFLKQGGQVKYQIIAAVAVCILASGCQRKAEGQTVAVVNGKEITIPDLNFALQQMQVPETADKSVVRSQALDKLVDRQLLADQARKEGIDKTPEFLNRERQGDEDLLISMLAARRMNTSQLPSDREVQAYISANPQMFANRQVWDLDQIGYATPKDPAILKGIQDAHSMDALIAVLQAHKVPFARQKNRLDTGVMPAEVYAKITAVPAGDPFVVPVGDKSIASVILNKEDHPLIGDQAKPAAVATMRKTQTAKSLQDLLKSLKSSAKIEYQPGYQPKKA
jgi:peptidyl-prolyl cis-trans isomerase C